MFVTIDVELLLRTGEMSRGSTRMSSMRPTTDANRFVPRRHGSWTEQKVKQIEQKETSEKNMVKHLFHRL